MKKTQFSIRNVGPLREVDFRFGDLTVLVGPQAAGKSIALQLLKLTLDAGGIAATLKKHGRDWDGKFGPFLDLYLGEGMHGVWEAGSSLIEMNGRPVILMDRIRRSRSRPERSYFIPAQRVLTLANGWPRPFTDYAPGDPFVVPAFSENLGFQMAVGLGRGGAIFPQQGRLKKPIRDELTRTVFGDFQLKLDKRGLQKRLVLEHAGETLPFMVWSAGQREFVPLLLGLYWLLPPSKTSRRGDIEWVVVEEIEMGLHPGAISAVMLLVLDLVARGYPRVILSTHSPHVLDIVWGLRMIREHGADPGAVLDLFGLHHSQSMMNMAENVLQKTCTVFYLDRVSGKSRDISSLDPGAADSEVSGWGGLTEFSGRVADVVARVVSAAEGR
ncbi:MAG: AAA family ATPase [Kiritimatiellaeota bacterium]|nr:AAA family ATPase [Kiritimatiellota bacterium]